MTEVFTAAEVCWAGLVVVVALIDDGADDDNVVWVV